MTRAQAMRAAAAIVALRVADLPGLCLLLEDGGCGRLAAALRARMGDKPAEVGGSPHPDAGLWAEAADRVINRETQDDRDCRERLRRFVDEGADPKTVPR